MTIYTRILGNASDPEWAAAARGAEVERLALDPWTAQKSRFVESTDRGRECAVALDRHTRLRDGDVLEYDAAGGRMIVVSLRLNEVLEIDLGALAKADPETIIRTAVELGHAVGNQHWPAVVRGMKVYVPLTVDRKVMSSVMLTHGFEGIRWAFKPGSEVIPYLAPHEIRRLFGGATPEPHAHAHDAGHPHHHEDGHLHYHEDGHVHFHDAGHPHRHEEEHAHHHNAEHPHRHEEEHAHPHDAAHTHSDTEEAQPQTAHR